MSDTWTWTTPQRILTDDQYNLLVEDFCGSGEHTHLISLPHGYVHHDPGVEPGEPWHWCILRTEDDEEVLLRWGSTRTWQDAMDITLFMLHRERTAFWADVVADIGADGGYLRRFPR